MVKLNINMTKKDCYNCAHLEWEDGEFHDSKGLCCNKRNYRSDHEENIHSIQLEKESYLRKAKSCCNPMFTEEPNQ